MTRRMTDTPAIGRHQLAFAYLAQWGWQASNLRPSDHESVSSRPPDIA
jgi:hypothetical protein